MDDWRKIVGSALGLILAGSLFLAAAHAGQETRKPDPWDVALGQAPAKAASWRNAYAGQPDAVLAGRKLFRRHCAECHGADAAGSMKAPDLRSPTVQQAAPGVLFWFLTNGNLWYGMPSWSGLPDQQRWQLVTYLKSLGASQGAPADPMAAARPKQ
jgi:mono/diheme cytochrome c family protein